MSAFVSESKEHEFFDYFKECVASYAVTDEGKRHLKRYRESREEAESNWGALLKIDPQSEHFVDRCVDWLIPHKDNRPNKDAGRWIPVQPQAANDFRAYMQGMKYVGPDEWPGFAHDLFSFVNQCIEKPESLQTACNNFAEKWNGVQSGTLSPILNALRSDRFLVVNIKPTRVLNWYIGTRLASRLTNYATANEQAIAFTIQLPDDLFDKIEGSPLRSDVFDMFCHWCVSITGWPPPPPSFRAGTGPVTVPGTEEQPTVIEGSKQPSDHTEIQRLLLKLGSDMEFDLWVARNDRGRDVRGERLDGLPRLKAKLPVQFDEATNKTIELIDVLWLKGKAIVAAFEIESTTSIYSGLLRMSDLLSMQPNLNIPLYLVAPDDRRQKVIEEVSRPIFSRLSPPLSSVCGYISFSRLRTELKQAERFVRYLKLDFLESLSDSCEIEEET